MITEASLYKKQMKQLNEEARKQLLISNELILNTPNNEELGMLVRKMYWDKIKQLDEHAKTLKDGK
jgi:hydroxymethylpyrimidine/phosphomethylpyrimidine kinase